VQHEGTYATLESPEDVFTVGLNRAVALLAEKKAKGGARPRPGALRKLGEHPQGGTVDVMSGRYGPYVKWGRVNATLPEGHNPETISLAEAVAISNDYAPEHLILNVREPRALLPRVENAGSVFLGPWSPEAVGDYCSGTNHVLPTYGYARAWSGVSVASFVKQITVQELSADGLRAIGPSAATLARAERLNAHERAVTLRLADLEAKR